MSPAPVAPLAVRTRVLGAFDECENVKTFRLSIPAEFSFIPGMFVMVNFPDDPKASRGYSIASSPFEKGFIEITVGKARGLSKRLFALSTGDELALKGPYGKWIYTDDIKRAALISGGTGITPFRSIARYVLAKKLPNSLIIFYSSRTPAEIIYRRELAELSRAGIKVHQTITRPQDMGPGQSWDGPTGRIDIGLLEKEVPDFLSTTYFMCGPAALVDELSAGLRARGVPRERVRYEKWGDYRL